MTSLSVVVDSVVDAGDSVEVCVLSGSVDEDVSVSAVVSLVEPDESLVGGAVVVEAAMLCDGSLECPAYPVVVYCESSVLVNVSAYTVES